MESWFSANNSGQWYRNHEHFLEGLKFADQRAIVHLQVKALPVVRRIAAGYGLPAEQAEEVLNDATLVFLRKIQTGAYQFTGSDPCTYCVEIARRIALMATRKNPKFNENIENLPEIPDPDTALLLTHRESADTVHQLLARLGAPCNEVIRLHHIEGYSDEEVIRHGWTGYGSTASLKVKRSECMKKLIELAAQWKKSNPV